ncbi:hypothetical protein GCM10020367_69420 [Streptomyces sannanensis]|uniref:Uncharacterized protein n=1 Tax=Streptomyces sannanensis TaxID=285536 RepID=A0ABP6SMF8_9ACTN
MTTESQPTPGQLTIGELLEGIELPAMDEHLRHVRETLAEVARHQIDLTPLTSGLERALTQAVEPVRLALADLPPLRLDLSWLDDLLRDHAPWQQIPDRMLESLAGVLDDARIAVEDGQERDVPEEMLAELEEQADRFAATAPGPVPPTVQKYMFAFYIAALMWSALMYVSVTSDTANAVLDETIQHGEIAVAVFVAACVAWDRRGGGRQDRED